MLVGPNYTLGGDSASIAGVVLPFDLAEGSPLKDFFEKTIASQMQQGKEGSRRFNRTNEDGESEEVFITFAPLEQRTLVPVNSSVFSAGVTSGLTLVRIVPPAP